MDAPVDAPMDPGPEPPPPVRRSNPWLRVLKWVAIVLGALLLLAAALLIAINSDRGRRFVTGQINGLEFASGLRIHVDQLEGSLYGKVRVRGLRLSDDKGVFFHSALVDLDWRPLAYLRNHIDIRSARVPTARLRRLPELRPSKEEGPLLPDIDIDVGALKVGRLQVDPAIAGTTRLLSIAGRAHIADRRAQIDGRIETLGAGPAGDRLVLHLDAVPDANRLDMQAALNAPTGGVIAGMLGLKAPLRMTVGGKGSWKSWAGEAQAVLGGAPVADLSIRAADGTFRIQGPLRAQPILRGPVERLSRPFVALNLVATLEDRRADTQIELRSSALLVRGAGGIDLGRSRFDGLRIGAQLLQPGAIAPNLAARNARLTLLLNGNFGTPQVAYRLEAAALSIAGTGVEQLRAEGSARVDADRIVIPVAAQAARVTGVNPALGGLLTQVRINGSLAIAGTSVLSDNLRIRSDRLNATLIVAADVGKGRYTAALQGRVDNYLVRGIGLLDITTNMDIVNTPTGFALTGRIAIQTRRIDVESARSLLGGNAIITAGLRLTETGVFEFHDLRLKAPQLTVTSGSGRYGPNGQVVLNAAGVSRAYGPLAISVTGTVGRPLIRLRAARPGLGIGLAGVEATLRGVRGGYAIMATGQSSYGPFTADLLVLTDARPLTIDVNRLTLAGLTFAGRVRQTAAGPFAGRLSLTGSGLEGSVLLAAAARYQRLDLRATASGARIPGEVPILIQRGVATASAILYPDRPTVIGDVQLAGVASGDLRIRTARAHINYQGGRGRAQLFADGSSGVPFRVAVNSELTPDRIRAAAQGNVNRVAFRLASMADIRRLNGGWQLAPVTVVMPQGNVRLAGRFGNGTIVQARFDDLDISVLNAFSPDLGLGGRATGGIDFNLPAGGGVPRADARVTVNDFTRTGVAVRSNPVTLALVGRLQPAGGAASAVIRRGGALIGRAQVRLQPLGPGAGWTDRLMAAPLAGGIRYNGPAEVLWSLSGIADQQVSGPVGLAADFGGRLQNPQLNGVIRAHALRYDNQTYGTRITDLALEGRFTSSQLQITRFTGRAGNGTVNGSGTVGLAAASGFPIDLRLTLDRARLARSDALGATVSGTLAINNSRASGAVISGDLRLPELRYRVIRQGSAELAQLDGARRKGEPLPRPGAQARAAGPPGLWRLDVRVRADNQVYISGMGLESEWETDLRVRGTSKSPAITGTASVLRGTYSFSGRRFELDQGELIFTGSQPIDPRIRLSASTTVEDVTAVINVSGSATMPRIAFSSTPVLPQDEILARLLFGGSASEISAIQALQLAASLNSLRGTGGGLNPLGKLRAAGGIERLRIIGADQTTGRGTAIAAGFQISNDIYLELITDARGFTATQIEIALSKTLRLLSQAGSFGSSSMTIRYRKNY